MHTAEALRRFDTNCLLVFTTTSTEHALDGFRVRAFHYLVKPCTEAVLTALFDEIARRLLIGDKYIDVNTAGGSIRLRLEKFSMQSITSIICISTGQTGRKL